MWSDADLEPGTVPKEVGKRGQARGRWQSPLFSRANWVVGAPVTCSGWTGFMTKGNAQEGRYRGRFTSGRLRATWLPFLLRLLEACTY